MDNFDQSSIQLIVDFLVDVQGLGTIHAIDKLLSCCGLRVDLMKLSQSHGTLRDALLDALTTMKRIDMMKNSLTELAHLLQKKLEERKAELMPSFLNCEIQTLPNEILGQVFEHVVHDDFSDESARGRFGPEVILCLVCRRFRSVALSIPSLWSRVSPGMPKQWLKGRLLISRDSPLEIVICGNESYDQLEQFFRLVTPHTSRWRSFRVLSLSGDFGYNLTECLKKHRFPDAEDQNSERRTNKSFFSDEWTMPALCRVDLKIQDTRWAQPYGFLRHLSLVPLRTFSLDARRQEDAIRRDHSTSLMDSLSSMPNLVELSLHFSTHFHGSGLNKIILQKVTSFTFTTQRFEAFRNVLTCLHMPSLHKLSLAIKDGTYYFDDREDFFTCECPFTLQAWLNLVPSERFVSVRELDISFWDSRNELISLDKIFSMFPSIEVFRLDLDVNRLTFYPTLQLPPLKSFSIQLLLDPKCDFLEPLVDSLKESGRWESFKSFHFICTSASLRREAEKVLTRDKVRWVDE